ncbi:C-C motif chemokine 19-like [Osmerus mordax]|uniref:C-C motif chemokine n=1 Tax=Osmerus mordax TaxID=8014 RepID=C1BM53_OSMMO|nr:Small inducible cytokine A21 precursor [Osmerus mordax]
MAAVYKLLFCGLLFCFLTVTQGQMVVDCCLKVSDREIPRQLVRSYQHQHLGQGCSLDAVIFVTKKNRFLCATPGQPWVRDLINHVDHLTKKCRSSNFQGKRCRGLKPQAV